MRWFAHQPFILREPLFPVSVNVHTLPLMLTALPRAVLSIVLYSLPVGLVFALRAPLRRPGVRLLFAMGMLGILLPLAWATLRHRPNAWLAPFTYDSLGIPGLQDFVMMPGVRPLLLTNPLRALMTVLTFAVLLGMVLTWRSVSPAAAAESNPGKLAARVMASETSVADRFQRHELLVLFGPYTAATLLLYVTRAFQWDRYLLPVASVAVLLTILAYQSRFGDRPPGWVWALVALLAVFDVAAHHDVYALYRARIAAAQQLESAGVPRAQFSGGFEYDAWTELQQTGYVKDPRLAPPPGRVGYRADVPAPHPCLNWFASYTPSVTPAYSIAFTLPPCMQATQLPDVLYRRWMPWRTETLKIGRLRR